MPIVTATPKGQLNGEVVTEFTDVTSTASVTYTYLVQQAAVRIENSGVSDILVTVGSFTDQVVTPNTSWRADVPFSFFSIRSAVNSQEFIATAFQNDVEGSGVADNIARTMAKRTGPFTYNTDIGLLRWRAALAKLKAGQQQIYNVSICGDSITEGVGSGGNTPSQYPTKGYLGRVRTAIAAKYGDVGQGMIPVYHPVNGPLWTFSGWALNTNFFGCTGYSMQSTVNGETATISFNGTGLGIVYPKRSDADRISVSIDGGTATVINQNAVTAVQALITEITGLANGPHTAVITSTLTGGKKAYIHGAYEIKGTAGVRFNMVGRSGTTSVQNALPNALPAEITIWNPVLTIIALTANDYTTATPLDTYTAQMQTIIDCAKSVGSDVLLVSTGLRTDSGAIPQSQYNDVQRMLALKNDCAYIDIFNRWSGDSNYAKNTVGFIFDTVHPNDYGHQDIATAVLRVIDEY